MNKHYSRTNFLISLICIIAILVYSIVLGFDVSSVYALDNNYITDVVFWDVANGRAEREYGFSSEDTSKYTVAIGDNARSIQIKVTASEFSDEDVYCQMTINDKVSEPINLVSNDIITISTPVTSELQGNSFRVGSRKQGKLVVGQYDSEKKEWGSGTRTYKFEFVRRIVLNSITADDATISPNVISPNTDEYEISVPDNIEKLKLTHSLSIRSTVRDEEDPDGTKYTKTTTYNVPEDAVTIDGESAIFDINKLEEIDGKKYIDIAVGYSKEGSDVVGSSYRFYINSYEVIPEIDHTPSVTIDGEKDITCDKDSVVDLKVKAEIEGEYSFSYQWFKGVTESSVTALIDGAEQDTYNPETKYARTQYYRCRVTNTVNGKKYIKYSGVFKVTTLCTYVTPPEVSRLTESQEIIQGDTVVFDINTDFYDWDGNSWHEPGYEWYINDKANTEGAEHFDLEPILEYPGSHGTHQFNDLGIYYVYCIATATIGDKSASTTSDFIRITVKEPEGLDGFEGQGTEESPYLISSLEDINKIRTVLKTGYYFKDKYFKLTSDLTLPPDWKPVGALKEGAVDEGLGVNVQPFSGILDGFGHTVTVAEGGKPLFGYVREASIKNLKIYGSKINGYGLIDNYVVDYGTDGNSDTGVPSTCDIENVTILSGTSILKSGFIGGYASGQNTVNITNCVVEKGVTIGYDKSQSEIGSFAGSVSGTITNCRSSADVYGNNEVGGLVGRKGQSMGEFNIQNSEFTGSINATGDRVGGIAGSGYYSNNHSAPNAPVVEINNCFAACDIEGKDQIGGILGAEPEVEQCWSNGTGGVQNSFYYGKITATGSNVGGIIGYYNSLDKYQTIANNFYLSTSGVTKGIGKLKNIITAAEDSQFGREDDFDADRACSAMSAEAFADGTVLDKLNAGEGSYGNWMQGEKYPVFTKEAVLSGITVSGYKTDYYTGDEFDKTGIEITAKYSDGTEQSVDASEVTFSGFDSKTIGQKSIEVSYGPVSTSFKVMVLYEDPPVYTVRFILLGDDIHSGTSEVHTLVQGGLKEWINKDLTINGNMTVKDVFLMALDEINLDHKGSQNSQYDSYYISGIQVPGTEDYLEEFTNGANSGWMYTVNGYHADVGVDRTYLEDGDEIIIHYTDDYKQEQKQMEGEYPYSEIEPIVDPEEEARKELDKAKSAAKAELLGYKSAADYRQAEKALLAEILEDAEAAVDAAKDAAEVEVVTAEYKEKLDALKTDAEYTAEEKAAEEERKKQEEAEEERRRQEEAAKAEALLAVKKEAVQELFLYVAAADYRDAEKEQIFAIQTEAEARINQALTEDEVRAALADAKALMDQLKTDEQYKAEEEAAKKKVQKIMVKVSRLRKYKAAKLRRKKAVFRALTVKGAKGKVTYKVSGNRKSKKALKFNKKTRKITVRKGTKKGLYKLKIRVNCAGTEKYLAASKKVTVKVRVK